MALRRSPRHRVLVVVPLALALGTALPSAAHTAPSDAHAEALTIDLGVAERNPPDPASDRVELGGSDRNDRDDSSGSRPNPPAAPEPPQQPQAPQPEPVFTARPQLPAGNDGSADAVPSVEGDGWLPTEEPPQATAVEATPHAPAAAPAAGETGGNPIGEAADADDPTASGSHEGASVMSVIARWGGALAAAVAAGLGVLGLNRIRARRHGD